MDGRKNNGGHKTAGRKPKADEIKLIEALDKHIDSDRVFSILQGLIEEKNIKAIQIYLDRRYGKPKERSDCVASIIRVFKLISDCVSGGIE